MRCRCWTGDACACLCDVCVCVSVCICACVSVRLVCVVVCVCGCCFVYALLFVQSIRTLSFFPSFLSLSHTLSMCMEQDLRVASQDGGAEGDSIPL